MADTKSLASKILKRKLNGANTSSSPPAAEMTVDAVVAPLAGDTKPPPPGWPARLERLGLHPLSATERTPGWVERRGKEIRAALQAQRDRLKETHRPKEHPFREAITDRTVVEGKKLSEWVTIEAEEISRQTKEQCEGPGVKRAFPIVDLTTVLPGWVSWALHNWREHDSPTAASVATTEWERLMEKANGALELALKDEKLAQEAQKAGNAKEAEKRTRYAAKQRDRHAALITEAREVLEKALAEKAQPA